MNYPTIERAAFNIAHSKGVVDTYTQYAESYLIYIMEALSDNFTPNQLVCAEEYICNLTSGQLGILCNTTCGIEIVDKVLDFIFECDVWI